MWSEKVINLRRLFLVEFRCPERSLTFPDSRPLLPIKCSVRGVIGSIVRKFFILHRIVGKISNYKQLPFGQVQTSSDSPPPYHPTPIRRNFVGSLTCVKNKNRPGFGFSKLADTPGGHFDLRKD